MAEHRHVHFPPSFLSHWLDGAQRLSQEALTTDDSEIEHPLGKRRFGNVYWDWLGEGHLTVTLEVLKAQTEGGLEHRLQREVES